MKNIISAFTTLFFYLLCVFGAAALLTASAQTAAAKEYKKAPFMIADEVVAKLDKNPLFDRIESVKQGVINIILSGQAVADYVNEMAQAKQFGYENPEKPKTVIV